MNWERPTCGKKDTITTVQYPTRASASSATACTSTLRFYRSMCWTQQLSITTWYFCNNSKTDIERERHVRHGCGEEGHGRVPHGHGGQRAGLPGVLRHRSVRANLEGIRRRSLDLSSSNKTTEISGMCYLLTYICSKKVKSWHFILRWSRWRSFWQFLDQ